MRLLFEAIRRFSSLFARSEPQYRAVFSSPAKNGLGTRLDWVVIRVLIARKEGEPGNEAKTGMTLAAN